MSKTETVTTPVVVNEQQQQYLTFVLSDEMFAIAILNVKEIIEYGSLTSVPMMPESVRGVINLRGAVVPVIDLKARFGGSPTEISPRTCIIIVETESSGERLVVGIIVDAVSEVLEILASQIEPPPAFGTHVRTDFIAGMGKVDKQFVIILDVNKTLHEDDLVAMAEMLEKTATEDEAS